MKYLEAKTLGRMKARARGEEEAKNLSGAPENKALSGPASDKAGEPAEEWTLATPPEQYIARNAHSETPEVQARVALARRILEARG